MGKSKYEQIYFTALDNKQTQAASTLHPEQELDKRNPA